MGTVINWEFDGGSTATSISGTGRPGISSVLCAALGHTISPLTSKAIFMLGPGNGWLPPVPGSSTGKAIA